jgi:hypothetical protein
MNDFISMIIVRPYVYGDQYGTTATYLDDVTGHCMSARFPSVLGVEEVKAAIARRRRELRMRAVS